MICEIVWRGAKRSLGALVAILAISTIGAAEPAGEPQASPADLQKAAEATDARLERKEADAVAALNEAQARSLATAQDCYARAVQHFNAGELDQALVLSRQAAETYKQLLGEEDRAHIMALVAVAAATIQQDGHQQAAPILERVVELRKKVLGVDHPDTACAVHDVAQTYAFAGDLEKAAALEQEALEITERLYGREHVETATIAIELAAIHRAAGDYDKAEPLYCQTLEIRQKLLGPDDPATLTALDRLATLYRRMSHFDSAERLLREEVALRTKALGDEHLDTLEATSTLAIVLIEEGKYGEAEPLFRQVLDARRKVLGDAHAETVLSMNNLGQLYQLTGRHAAARPLFVEALEISCKLGGDDGPETIGCLTNLAMLSDALGEPAAAAKYAAQAVELSKTGFGENSPKTAEALHVLASVDQTQGDYAAAEPLFQQAYEILKKTRGEDHSDTLTALSNLAGLYSAMGDFNRAETLQRQVLDVTKKRLGDKHVETATCLNNLATTYDSLHDYPKAQKCYLDALRIYLEVYGREHPATASCLSNLAYMCRSIGRYEEAQGFESEALDIRKKIFGPDHPDTLCSLGNLAMTYFEQGEYRRAEPLLKQVTEQFQRTLGPSHPLTAAHLSRLAWVYQRLGDSTKAEPLARDGVNLLFAHLENRFGAESERQKLLALADLRDNLDLWLTVAHQTRQPADVLYEKLLAWKGVVFASESAVRSLRQNPAALELFQQYQDVSRQLATAALALPRNFDERGKRDAQLKELTEQKESLEQRLAQLDANFGRQRARLTPAELQAALPADVVLVDFFQYTDADPHPGEYEATGDKRRLIAFIVRRDQPIVEVQLGPVAPIAAAIDQWRQCLGDWTGAADENPGQVLKRLIWTPLAALCKDAATVLVSPDGVLSQLPLGALPGDAADEMLLASHAFGVVPVPQMLPRLLAEESRTTTDDDPASPSLLLLGGVDYGAAHGGADPAGKSRGLDESLRAASVAEFVPLPGTLGEIKTIDADFTRSFSAGRAQLLEGQAATEAAFRELAPQCRWLHLSTHGFFAPEKLKSALARSTSPMDDRSVFSRSGVSGFHPGLLSGLAMAGANNQAQPGEDDGILTALEVASLDLTNVDVAVLSACETGLGRVAGGEGVLGLQRAFQMSGAKTVVASLWSVPDQATMRLMERFYSNLWDRKMPKLAALREAQLWLLSDPANRSVMSAKDQAASTGKTLPPRYWAAFVLSGDWR